VRVTVDFRRQNARHRLSIPECSICARPGCSRTSAGSWPINANLTETDEPERVETALVDANYFTMLGVSAERAVCSDRRMRSGIAEVAVISDAIWKRRFGGDPNVIGKRIGIDNDMYSIIGVAPASFRHPGA